MSHVAHEAGSTLRIAPLFFVTALLNYDDTLFEVHFTSLVFA